MQTTNSQTNSAQDAGQKTTFQVVPVDHSKCSTAISKDSKFAVQTVTNGVPSGCEYFNTLENANKWADKQNARYAPTKGAN